MAAVIVVSLLVIILYTVYYISKRKYNYWKDLNVPHIKPLPFFGNYKDYVMLNSYIGHFHEKILEKFPDAPYIGAFYGTEPTIIVQDPEIIKLITTKDFYYFNSREISDHCHREPVTKNLFFTHGDRWKAIRQNCTPLFSSSKMKNMFHLIEECSFVFEDLIDETVKKSRDVEIRHLTASFTMDCIGACIFGVNTNVMTKTEGNDFVRMGDLSFEVSYKRGVSLLARAIWPSIFYGLGFQTFPDELNDFFNKLLKSVFKARNHEMTCRQDMVDLFIEMKKKEYFIGDCLENFRTKDAQKYKLKVDDELLAAQGVTFFSAGYETSSSTVSFLLYELAKDQECQEKVLEEVDAYMKRHNGKLEYECVNEMPYTEACVDETLRLYPVLGMVTREVVEDYRLPDGVLLKRGVRVHLPVYRLHRRARFFPEPAVFRPARFLPDQRRHIPPYTYMPFGEGPRICIGMRFAKMQMMAGLITYLKKYRFKLAPGMPKEVTLEPKAFVTAPKEGIHLTLIEREGWEARKFNREGANLSS